jgi:hypothetical protein
LNLAILALLTSFVNNEIITSVILGAKLESHGREMATLGGDSSKKSWHLFSPYDLTPAKEAIVFFSLFFSQILYDHIPVAEGPDDVRSSSPREEPSAVDIRANTTACSLLATQMAPRVGRREHRYPPKMTWIRMNR